MSRPATRQRRRAALVDAALRTGNTSRRWPVLVAALVALPLLVPLTLSFAEATPAAAKPTSDHDLAKDSLRDDLAGEKYYFVMPDRFANGDPNNDRGGSDSTDRLVHGFDPKDKGFYHGGDLAGVIDKLDYIEGMGTTAIWMTPMFTNRWVQGTGENASAGYHGYWTTDFTNIDPHFGTNAEMRDLIAQAHARGIKVFFDIVANHTADVVDYAQHEYSYRSKADYPYKDAAGNVFDDRDYAGKPNFPAMTPDGFPYTPTFRTPEDAKAKTPDWLNDVTLYHNRGDSTFQGESAEYGDFVGLDDLFTERPEVVKGMTDIFTFWIDELDIDGYRVDTVKHVNMEFWQALAPAVKKYANDKGKKDFFIFGEIFDADPAFVSRYTTTGRIQAALDFPFQDAARKWVAGGPTKPMQTLFDDGDQFTDADSNAYSLPTFLGNHDMGRIGFQLKQDRPGASDGEILARDRLAHVLLYTSRGNPVVYYGDEQGFAGDGGDKDARQDMFASKVPSYLDDDLIGTDRTVATDSYRPDHPLYQHLRGLSALTRDHETLRTGAQIPRLSGQAAGVLAYSRYRHDDGIEYVVALNNTSKPQTAKVSTYSAGMQFRGVWPLGRPNVRSGGDKAIKVTLPPLSAVVYRAQRAAAAPAAKPALKLNIPTAEGGEVVGRTGLSATMAWGTDTNAFAQVTFAVRQKGDRDWTVLGTDDNAPYRVFADLSAYPKGTELEIRAVGKDQAGRLAADQLSVVAGSATDLSKARAVWVSRDVVAWKTEVATGDAEGQASAVLRYSPDAGISVAGEAGKDARVDAPKGAKDIPLSPIEGGLPADLKAKFPHLADYPAFRVGKGDVAAALRSQVVALQTTRSGALAAATGVQLAGVLDDVYAAKAATATLGPRFDGAKVTLSLWAPTARTVALHLDDKAASDSSRPEPTPIPMRRDDASGVWTATGPTAQWAGKRYEYEVTVYAPTTGKVEKNEVTDPYSRALTVDSEHSVLADLNDPATMPAGWQSEQARGTSDPTAKGIYELQVRDFSATDETVPAELRGTYKAFTVADSAGMTHLRALADAGMGSVHLLPTFDIATIPERRGAQQRPDCDLGAMAPDSDEQQDCVGKVAAKDAFNWGYDPLHYDVPEGSYATNPDGAARSKEYREMVAALHKTGLSVVTDVVYNHTTKSGQDPQSVLDRVVPGYYHRLDADGAVTTSTCCANTAPENAMMGKLVVDSVVHWAKTYKVDGFRFDLMGHHPKANMLAVRAALDRLTLANDGVDGKKIYVYGEGWNFGEVADNARFEQATQANMAGTGIGTFNDRLRDAVRGGGPFDDDPRVQGLGSGLAGDPNGSPANGDEAAQKARLLRYHDQIKVGMTGNLADYRFVDRTGKTVTGKEVDYNGSPAGYTAAPREAITYVDAHDNETLFDSQAYKLPQGTSHEDRVRMQQVALATVLLGQGVPFMHAGADIQRSKSLDRNSFDSGDWFNRVDWTYRNSTFGSGLPPKKDNEAKWQYAKPLLGDENVKPTAEAIGAARDRTRDLLRVRGSSPLFHLGSADLVQQKVSFPLGGPDQPAGTIVMRIDDTVGPDVDPSLAGLVVVINAAPEERTVSVPAFGGKTLTLHPAQANGADETVKRSVADGGSLTVPARTVAVFVAG